MMDKMCGDKRLQSESGANNLEHWILFELEASQIAQLPMNRVSYFVQPKS